MPTAGRPCRARVEESVAASTLMRPFTTAVPLSAETAACRPSRTVDPVDVDGVGRGVGLAATEGSATATALGSRCDTHDGPPRPSAATGLRPRGTIPSARIMPHVSELHAHDQSGAAPRASPCSASQRASAGRTIEDIGVALADRACIATRSGHPRLAAQQPSSSSGFVVPPGERIWGRSGTCRRRHSIRSPDECGGWAYRWTRPEGPAGPGVRPVRAGRSTNWASSSAAVGIPRGLRRGSRPATRQ